MQRLGPCIPAPNVTVRLRNSTAVSRMESTSSR